ncbi:MAG: hypothetical protein KF812_07510 [Fimbriimonadaceae bacterium]|nr:hypothetical protein [Fimbriimonadaceae bacterium]
MITNLLSLGWDVNPTDPNKWFIILGVMLAGGVGAFLLSKAPTSSRRSIIVAFTFVSGLFWVLKYLWPEPIAFREGDVPRNGIEGFGKYLTDGVPFVSTLAQTLTAFLLGLGIFSLLRVHLTKISRKQKDWQFSVILLISLVTVCFFGYWDWILFNFRMKDVLVSDDPSTWTWVNQVQDILFDGLLQNMDAAMFSLIAFFIFSAAYRAFRIRSVESSLLMVSALIVMLSLMGALTFVWNSAVLQASGGNPVHFLSNFRLDTIAGWVQSNVQVPALRALEFGVGLGALAMGLRLWLGLERGGVSQ